MDIAKIYLSNIALQNKQLLNYINNKEVQNQYNPAICCKAIETNCVKILQQIEFISNQKVYNLSSCTECQQNKTEVSLLKKQLKTYQQNENQQNLSVTNNNKLIQLNKEANAQYNTLFEKYNEQSAQLQKALSAVTSFENFELTQFSKFKQQCVQQIDVLTDNLSTQQFINQDLSEQLKNSQTAISAKNAEILSLKNQLLTKSKQLSQITSQVNNILETTQSCYQNQKHFDDLQQASKRLLFNAKRTLNVLMVQTDNQSQLLTHFKIINELNKQQQTKLDEQTIITSEAERRLSQFKQTVISLQSDQIDEYNQYPEISFIIDFKNEIKQLKETNQQQITQIEQLNVNIQQIESQNSELQQIIIQLQDIEANYNSALDTIEQYKEQTSDLQQQITEKENLIELQNNEINRLNQEVLTIIDNKDKIILEITGKLQNKLNMEDSQDSQQKEPQPAQQEYQFTFNEESQSDDKNKQNDKELETKNEKLVDELVDDKEQNEEENEEKELQDK
ncbi:Hypothetical_protein [Hexamita inflata]|uniref:Hypothetical_protein n=1 Tax=Hexamita inflata TaxID=28002 RepID=A0AA86RBE1_9EUKA|nr:Hypothetical protein HINF_LOCUS57517 [Hexamita inflata]